MRERSTSSRRRRRPARPSVIACRASTAHARWRARTSSAPTRPPTVRCSIRVVRSPFHRARFQLGDLDAYVVRDAGRRRGVHRGRHRRPQPIRRDPRDRRSAGVRRAARSAVPGRGGRDGRRRARARWRRWISRRSRSIWEELPPLMSIDEAQADGAPRLHDARDGQRPDPRQRPPRRSGRRVRGGRGRGRGRVRDGVHRARLHRAGGRVRASASATASRCR